MKGRGERREERGENRAASGQWLVASDNHQSSIINHQSSNPQSPIPNPIPVPRPPSPASKTSPLRILILGDIDRSEFLDAHSHLKQFGTLHHFSSVVAAACALEKGTIIPDVIVIAQSYPGEFSHEAVDQLRHLAPLARVVGLMGSWCEGEMRTGSPWPAVVRNYWHQWPLRCDRQFASLARGECGAWSLPMTATDEERLLADAADDLTGELPPSRGLVLIHAETREIAQWFSDACRRRGYATVWQRPPASLHADGVRMAIFDGTDLHEKQCEALGRLVQAVHPAPVVALASFPRIEDQRRAYAAGAAMVISKPTTLQDFWEIVEAEVGQALRA